MVLKVTIQVTSDNPALKANLRDGRHDLTLVSGQRYETVILRDKPLRICDARGDWRDSLLAELTEIEEKLKSLDEYVNSPIFLELPMTTRSLLKMQVLAYQTLTLVITERLK